MYHDVFVKEHSVLQLHASLSKMKDLLAVSLEDVVRLSPWKTSPGPTPRTHLWRWTRVHNPLPNSYGFGDACWCHRRTPMNPHVKCKFWRFQCRKKTAWLPCFQFAAKLIE
ncbi:hypothetical protein HPB51_026125 [Rhipicephalus microplus]|uniref:Uncharacterized protein n=1 Tax=Rhipicephalus microplus TaxID=6941 RepID=A0A9J6F3B2_RHIMP|nr:hypothetical protein HPB51_014563 [Rhipicephalus microplus]KAH8042860.1 hypothetical protein HPB51_026125 [Rhipicephalus microplus]